MVNEAITVKRLNEQHVADLLPLISSYQRFYGRRNTSDTVNREFFLRFLRSDERGVVIGARIDSTLVGFATLYWTFSSVAATDIAVLNDLFVDGAHRGRGIGRALVVAAQAEATARGCRRMDWFTQETNAEAQRLYSRFAAHRSEWIEYSLDLL